MGAILTLGVALPTMALPTTVSAAALDDACKNGGTSAICDDNSSMSIGDIIKTIINVLLFIVGAISVIMIIIGGIRYTVSSGDQGAITGAKNTILYAVVGLIVAFLGYAIVSWVSSVIQ